MCEHTYECARPNHRHSCVLMWKGWIVRDILIIKRKLVPVERSESNGWMKRRLIRVKHVCRLDLFCFLFALCDRKIYQRLDKITRHRSSFPLERGSDNHSEENGISVSRDRRNFVSREVPFDRAANRRIDVSTSVLSAILRKFRVQWTFRLHRPSLWSGSYTQSHHHRITIDVNSYDYAWQLRSHPLTPYELSTLPFQGEKELVIS
jgi:hypothetical protein